MSWYFIFTFSGEDGNDNGLVLSSLIFPNNEATGWIGLNMKGFPGGRRPKNSVRHRPPLLEFEEDEYVEVWSIKNDDVETSPAEDLRDSSILCEYSSAKKNTNQNIILVIKGIKFYNKTDQ